MATSKPRPPRSSTAVSPKTAPTEGRSLRFAKEAGVVVGLVSGIVGLLFLFFPGLRPTESGPNPDQSATVSGVVVNPRTTHGQFLDYSDQPKLGFTKEQLNVVGASAFARLQIVGYNGTKLALQRQLVNARTGDVIGKRSDFYVTPGADKISHRWWDWVELPHGRGSYVMVIKVYDERTKSAITCGQTRAFGGLGGLVAAKPPQLCEGT